MFSIRFRLSSVSSFRYCSSSPVMRISSSTNSSRPMLSFMAPRIVIMLKNSVTLFFARLPSSSGSEAIVAKSGRPSRFA